MYRRFHDRFGTAGLVVAVIALIAALGGTAIAAGGLTGKQKKEVTKIAKKYAGDDGAPGATGPAGLAGTNGTNGTNGKDGANGTNGTNGSNGVGAEGVAFGPTEEPEGNPCAGLGGVEVKSASPEPSYVCNGENGAEGSPWTAGGVLPNGATETGAWILTSASPKIKPNLTEFIATSISFPIPLKTVVEGPNTKLVKASEAAPAECDDGEGFPSGYNNPEADSGYLCVFVQKEVEAPAIAIRKIGGSLGAEPMGALLTVNVSTAPPAFQAHGTFAVTGAP